jgi:hypothetical protein
MVQCLWVANPQISYIFRICQQAAIPTQIQFECHVDSCGGYGVLAFRAKTEHNCKISFEFTRFCEFNEKIYIMYNKIFVNIFLFKPSFCLFLFESFSCL